MEKGQPSKKSKITDKGKGSEKVHIPSFGHRIPGPAGIVQAAYETRWKGKESAENEVLPTQKYVERALVEPQYDESLIMNPWETFCSSGYKENDSYSPISTIIQGTVGNKWGRIPLVAGIVKPFTPNGFGDSWLELKDETMTIGASINRMVLNNSDYSSRSGVGAVLVLGDIAYFKPGKDVYLNITPANIVLVITKEGELIEPAADLSLF